MKGITRCATATAIMVALVGSQPGPAQGSFILTDDQHLDVTAEFDEGTLFDRSTARVLDGGFIGKTRIRDEAVLSVAHADAHVVNAVAREEGRIELTAGAISNSPAPVAGASPLSATDNSTVVISGGSVWSPDRSVWVTDDATLRLIGGEITTTRGLRAAGASLVQIVAGAVAGGDAGVEALGKSRVELSGGLVAGRDVFGGWEGVRAREDSMLEMTGGTLLGLETFDQAQVTISGGTAMGLEAAGGTVKLDGRDFVGLDGVSLVEHDVVDGVAHYEVLGTGFLMGNWRDGTEWAIPIDVNSPTSTILAIPEPASIAVLAVGGLALVRRRR